LVSIFKLLDMIISWIILVGCRNDLFTIDESIIFTRCHWSYYFYFSRQGLFPRWNSFSKCHFYLTWWKVCVSLLLFVGGYSY
jgi:hypothetical protein